MRYSAFTPKWVPVTCGTCKGRGRVWADGKFIPCMPEKFQRLTMHTLPGRNRRDKRARLVRAYRTYLRQKWAAERAA